MAVLKNQILKGGIGPLSVYERNGKTVLRVKKNKTSNKKASSAQIRNRSNFKTVQDWVKPILPFVRLGFRNYPGYDYAYNAAREVLRKTALQETGTESIIDPALAQVSAGPLEISQDLQAVFQAGQGIFFTWSQHLGEKMSPRDQIMLLAYQPESKTAFYDLKGPKRRDGAAMLKMPQANPGGYHIYAAFISENGKTQSDSAYLGEVVVQV